LRLVNLEARMQAIGCMLLINNNHNTLLFLYFTTWNPVCWPGRSLILLHANHNHYHHYHHIINIIINLNFYFTALNFADINPVSEVHTVSIFVIFDL
jgi:hypothetical protein